MIDSKGRKWKWKWNIHIMPWESKTKHDSYKGFSTPMKKWDVYYISCIYIIYDNMIQILILPHLVLYLPKGNYHPGSLPMISWGPLRSQKFAVPKDVYHPYVGSLWEDFPNTTASMNCNKDCCFTGVSLLGLFNAFSMTSLGGFSSPALPFRRTKVSSSGSQSSIIVATGF